MVKDHYAETENTIEAWSCKPVISLVSTCVLVAIEESNDPVAGHITVDDTSYNQSEERREGGRERERERDRQRTNNQKRNKKRERESR